MQYRPIELRHSQFLFSFLLQKGEKKHLKKFYCASRVPHQIATSYAILYVYIRDNSEENGTSPARAVNPLNFSLFKGKKIYIYNT